MEYKSHIDTSSVSWTANHRLTASFIFCTLVSGILLFYLKGANPYVILIAIMNAFLLFIPVDYIVQFTQFYQFKLKMARNKEIRMLANEYNKEMEVLNQIFTRKNEFNWVSMSMSYIAKGDDYFRPVPPAKNVLCAIAGISTEFAKKTESLLNYFDECNKQYEKVAAKKEILYRKLINEFNHFNRKKNLGFFYTDDQQETINRIVKSLFILPMNDVPSYNVTLVPKRFGEKAKTVVIDPSVC